MTTEHKEISCSLQFLPFLSIEGYHKELLLGTSLLNSSGLLYFGARGFFGLRKEYDDLLLSDFQERLHTAALGMVENFFMTYMDGYVLKSCYILLHKKFLCLI